MFCDGDGGDAGSLEVLAVLLDEAEALSRVSKEVFVFDIYAGLDVQRWTRASKGWLAKKIVV